MFYMRTIIICQHYYCSFKQKFHVDFLSVSSLVLFHVTKQFAEKKLVLYLDKTNLMKLITKNSSHST